MVRFFQSPATFYPQLASLRAEDRDQQLASVFLQLVQVGMFDIGTA